MASIQKRETRDGVRYRALIRIQGLPSQQATFTTHKAAKTWARETEAGIRNGTISSRLEDHTFAELLDRFEAARNLAAKPKKGDHGYRGHLKYWRQELGHYFLRHIKTTLVRDAKQKLLSTPTKRRGRRRSGSTVNRYMTTLSTVLRLGTRLEWIDVNIVRNIEKEKEPKGRVRFLSRPVDEANSELDRILATCAESRSKDLRDLVVLALYTGCRANELLQLRASWVHLSTGGFALPAEVAKNGEARFVPLAGEALEIVERRQRGLDRSQPLFPGRPGHPRTFPRKAWDLALERAGVKNFRFHDLRHTHASYLAMLGASASELKESLGHKTLAMVDRYTHLANQHKSQVASRLAAEFGNWKQR